MSPFKSNRQRRYLYAFKPDVARKFEQDEKQPVRRRRRKRGALSKPRG